LDARFELGFVLAGFGVALVQLLQEVEL
jgi:hypothetical protein